LLLQGKYGRVLVSPISKGLNIIAWLAFGPLYMVAIAIEDTVRIARIMSRNKDFEKSQIYILKEIVIHRDDDIYLQRYDVVKRAFQEYFNENEKSETVSMDEILNYIIRKHSSDEEGAPPPPLAPLAPHTPTIPNKTIYKARLAEIIRRHHIGKLKKSVVMDPKDMRNYVKALDNMLNMKNAQYNSFKEADLDVNIITDLLEDVNIKNIIYLRLKRISTIQSAILEAQGADLVTVLKRLDDIEEKISLMLNHFMKVSHIKL